MYILYYTSHLLLAIMFFKYILTNPIFVPFVEQWSQQWSHLNMCEQFSQLKSCERPIIVNDN